MKKTLPTLVVIGLLFLGAAALPAQTKVREKDLPPQYREWLKITATIITPAEKDVFLSLSNDRERDAFIEAFWKQRDPTPGTPQNEYKDEVIRRFQHANKFYGRGTTREGWMTDMGRMYMILGEPVSVEHNEEGADIWPAQVWYYYGDTRKGLPTYFGLVFFQRGGGEFKLYNPVSDGPASLLINDTGVDRTDYEKLYERIRKTDPALAAVSISLIPGEFPYGFTPSPQNNIILSTIFESPKKDISTAYATHFLSYRGLVSTEYLTNYVESSTSLALLEDPLLGLNFCHFSISPRSISIDYFQPKDQYYCSFKLSVSLRRGGRIVFQYTKDYPFYFPADKAQAIQGSGVSVLDVFPVAEGTYGLNILLQNTVGKEFCLFEKELVIPPAGGSAKMSAPVIGYKIQDSPATTNVPFKFLDKQILTDPKGTLGRSDDIAFMFDIKNVSPQIGKEGTIEAEIRAAQIKDKPVKTLTIKLADRVYRKTMAVIDSLPARDFPPDYYEITFMLKDGKGAVLDQATAPFIISASETVPHPATALRTLPVANNFLYFYGLAHQYDSIGAADRAEDLFKRAQEMRPDYPEGLIDFADFLIRVKKYDEARNIIGGLKENEKFRFNYFLLEGQALMGKRDYGPAIASLLEGNRLYNSDTRLLNALGSCYNATGKKKEALEALTASLRLNPDQADIKDLVAKIEKSLK